VIFLLLPLLLNLRVYSQSTCFFSGGTCSDPGAIATRSDGCLNVWQYVTDTGSVQTYYGCGAYDADSRRFWCMTNGFDVSKGNSSKITFSGSNFTNCLCSGWTNYLSDGTSQTIFTPNSTAIDDNGNGECPTNVLYESSLSQGKNWKYCTQTPMPTDSLSVNSDGCLSYWKEADTDGGIIKAYQGCQAYDREEGKYWCLTNGYVPGIPTRLSQTNATAQGGVSRNCLPGGWTYYYSNQSSSTFSSSLVPSDTGDAWCPSNVYQPSYIADQAENQVWKYCDAKLSSSEKEVLTLKSTACKSESNITWEISNCRTCIQGVAHIGAFVNAWTLEPYSYSAMEFTIGSKTFRGRLVPLQMNCMSKEDSSTDSTFWSSASDAQLAIGLKVGITGTAEVAGGNAEVGFGSSLFATSNRVAARAWKKQYVYTCSFDQSYYGSESVFTTGVQKSIKALPSTLNSTTYPLFKSFFNTFGTHVVVEAMYGGEYRSEIFQEVCSSGGSINSSISGNLQDNAKLLVGAANVSTSNSFSQSSSKKNAQIRWFGGDSQFHCKEEDVDWSSFFTSVRSNPTLLDFKVVGVESFIDDPGTKLSFVTAVQQYLMERKASTPTKTSSAACKSAFWFSTFNWPGLTTFVVFTFAFLHN
jgi:hypothetical protein